YLVSYAVKEILWLRIVTCAASLFLLLALASEHAAIAMMAWQLVFFVINSARLAQLVHERSPVRLDRDARELARRVFPGLRPRELVRLLAIGRIVEHAADARVVRKGEAPTELAIVIAGGARVELGERRAELGYGAFIGELSYLTGRPPGADVFASGALRVVAWPTTPLRAYLDANPDTRTAMQLVLGF